jgi:hypothetical protein
MLKGFDPDNLFLKYKINLRLYLLITSILLVVTNSYNIIYKELLVEPHNVRKFIDYEDNIKDFETNINEAKKIDLEKERMIAYFRNSAKKSYNENDDIIEKFRDLIAKSYDKKGSAMIAMEDIDLFERYYARKNKYVFKKEDIKLLNDRIKFNVDEFNNYFEITNDSVIFKNNR